MNEKLPQTIIFRPSITPSVKQIWLTMLKLDALLLSIAGIHYLIEPESPHRMLILMVLLGIPLLATLWGKNVTTIEVSISDKTLSAMYLTAFGATFHRQISLPTAHYSYKLNIGAISSSNWHMLIYNNYFKNRLSIYSMGGYTKEQLDEIDKVIKKIIDDKQL